jgi:transposase-like protein
MAKHTDTCPHCLRRGNTPLAERTQAGGSTRAVYRCRSCRKTWTTDWNDRT